MSNYSFDYANSHWLVLDANPYMNWTDQSLRNWVADDLAKTKLSDLEICLLPSARIQL